jgi:hypothetical protein
MANTLTNLIPILYAALDIVSRELVGFVPAVMKDSSGMGAAVDQTINIPIVGAVSAFDVTPGATPGDNGDASPGNTTMTISKSRQAPVRWNGEEQKAVKHTGLYNNVNTQRFAQAIRTLVNEVETDLGALYTGTSRSYGAAATVPFGTINELDDSAQIRKILEDNGAPMTDLQMVLGTGAIANMRGIQAALYKVNESGSDQTLRRGIIGDLHGFDLHSSAQVAAHTAGTASSATTDNAGYAVGATVLTLASVGTGTILVGDNVTFAGDTNIYTVKSGDADVSGGGTITLEEPGLRVAMSAATKAITMIATHTAHMAFSRSAIALITRPPAVPEEGDMADDRFMITDPISGITFEITMYKQYKQIKFEVALAWGVKLVAPRHTARLLG